MLTRMIFGFAVSVLLSAASATSSGCVAEGPREPWVLTSPVLNVTLRGDLNRSGLSGDPADNAIVTFEAHEEGQMFASGPLYDAGPHDHSFHRRYPYTEWVTPHALKFLRWPDEPARIMNILVRNDTKSRIEWLLIRHQDLVLIFRLAPSQEVSIPSLRWGDPSVDILGQFAGGAALPVAELLLSERTLQLLIAIGPETTTIREREAGGDGARRSLIR